MFDWKARYIKTADNITPGTANASATVNIRYELGIKNEKHI
ncbi:hypothetical protein AB6G03_01200 [Providencia hangzhouensis]